MAKTIQQHASNFYLLAAVGNQLETVIDQEAAARMAAVFELCRRSRLRREAAKKAKRLAGELALSALLILPHYLGLHVLPHFFK